MFPDIGAELWFSASTGLLLAGVGVAVALVRPKEPANVAFGLYAAGFGLAAAASNVLQGVVLAGLGVWPSLVALLGLASALAIAGLALFAVRFPRPLGQGEGPLVAFAALAWGGILLAHGLAFTLLLGRPDGPYAEAGVDGSYLASEFLFDTLRGLMLAVGALFALRFRSFALRGEGDLRSLGLVAAAVALYPAAYGAWAGLSGLVEGDFAVSVYGYVALAATLGTSALWVWNTRLPRGARIARNLAVFVWVPPLVGAAFAAGAEPLSPSFLMRILMVLLLGYTVVRHQLLGIDVKVRWTISKSTIAAAFVVVFFVAGEGAQILFGGENQWIGLAAAGALVFALAPLQRVADRVAQAAVPVEPAAPPAAGAPPTTPAEREAAYRQAVRLALRDRTLTRDEERHLLQLAHVLGIGPLRAGEIHDEMGREAGVAASR